METEDWMCFVSLEGLSFVWMCYLLPDVSCMAKLRCNQHWPLSREPLRDLPGAVDDMDGKGCRC